MIFFSTSTLTPPAPPYFICLRISQLFFFFFFAFSTYRNVMRISGCWSVDVPAGDGRCDDELKSISELPWDVGKFTSTDAVILDEVVELGLFSDISEVEPAGTVLERLLTLKSGVSVAVLVLEMSILKWSSLSSCSFVCDSSEHLRRRFCVNNN